MFLSSTTLELLDQNKIKLAIEPERLQFLDRIDIFNSIVSTNTYLLDQAKSNGVSGWVCVAEQQTKGRGRLGREWFSPQGGNIYFSLLWKLVGDQHEYSGLSIAVAVMIIRVLKNYGITNGIELKWPNDILFAGRKLAGILLERVSDYVVIGIGLNVYLPQEADAAWIGLGELTNQPVSRNYLLGLLINELLAQLPHYQQRGLAAFLPEWRQYDVLFNQNVTVHVNSKEIIGVAQGVNEAGELLLRDAQGEIHHFCYGEVSVRKK